MEMLKQFKKLGMQGNAKKAEEDLIAKGYVHNDTFGWEKMNIIEKFNLNPNMTGVPSVLVDEVDYKESKKEKRDPITGKRSGEFEIELLPVKTGKQIWVTSQNYLDYLDYKKHKHDLTEF